MRPYAVITTVSAAEDLEAGRDFYETINPGLGSYFIESLLSDIESLKLYVGVHRTQYGLFCFSSKRFPYALYYYIREDEARIIAILDQRQEPRSLHSTLTKRQSP